MRNVDYVIGANYGDEGKGRVTASLALSYKNKHESMINILTNGGPQRAHSYVHADKGSLTFKHLGSALPYGADLYIEHTFLVNPMEFIKEYDTFVEKFGFEPKVYVNPWCKITTPWDMMANQINELNSGHKNGSCGMGIWETVVRSKYVNVYLSDFLFKNPLLKPHICNNVMNWHFYIRKLEKSDLKKYSYQDVWYDIQARWFDDCVRMANLVTFNTIFNLPEYDHYIYENGQGLCLSEEVDTELSTPSKTGLDLKANSINKTEDKLSVHYVTRPYLTRHGHDIWCGNGSVHDEEHNQWNEWQGSMVKNDLDLGELHQRLDKDSDGLDYTIHLTHCDEMDRFNEFKKEFEDRKIVTYSSPIVI